MNAAPCCLMTLLAIAPAALLAQAPEPEPRDTADPAREVSLETPDPIDLMHALRARGFYDPPEGDDPRYVIRIPVAVHQMGSRGPIGGSQALVGANAWWAGTGMEFYESSFRLYGDDPVHVDSVDYMNLIMFANNVPNAINVYFVASVILPNRARFCAVGTRTSSGPLQGIFVGDDPNAGCLGQSNNTWLAHGLGNFFDVLDTDAAVNGFECPDGSNCATAGDLLCDTPADPGLDNEQYMQPPDCAYTGNVSDCNGQRFNPDVTLIMSNARVANCRTRFTAGQRSLARATLMNLRPSLIEAGQPSIIWVDFAANSIFPNGDFTNPYTTFLAGLNAAPPGGRVVLRNRTSSERGVFSQRVVIDSFYGSAIIGL